MSTPDVGVYDAAPEQYDAFQTQFFQHGSRAVAEAYQGMFKTLELGSRQRVLEVGIGTGLNLKYYPAGARVVGLDRSEPMLSVARKRVTEVDADVELICGNGLELPFGDQSFDAVVCTFVLCSCASPQQMLEEMVRVCRVGGRLGVFDFHKASANQGLLADQFLLRETLLQGLVAQGRRVAVCDTLYDLDEHRPPNVLQTIYDQRLEGSFSEAFRATVFARSG